MKILLIEDNKVTLDGLAELLRLDGWEVRTAMCGREGWDVLKSGFVPDLVITDLLMQGMGGKEFIEQLREDAAYKDIPVLVLTAATEQVIDGTVDIPNVRVVQKPLDIVLLRSMLASASNNLWS